LSENETPIPDVSNKFKLELGSHGVDSKGMALACKDHYETDYASDDLLNALIDVEKLYERLDEPVEGGEAFDLSKDEAKMRLDEGFHLLDISKVKWNEDALLAHLGRLLDFFERADPARGRFLKQARESIDNGSMDCIAWLAEHAPFDAEALEKRAAASGMPEDMALFIGDHLARPALIPCARRLSDHVDHNKWLRGQCPICGNKPSMAALNPDEGQRVLRCSRCRFVWTFQRILCPNCGNEDHAKLRYLSSDEKSQYRLDVCEECKTYVKTIDYRKAPQDKAWVPEVEDAATIYLDLLAKQEGYERL